MKIIPQDLGDIRHAHRHAGVAAIRLLDGVHARRPDRVGARSTRRHALSPVSVGVEPLGDLQLADKINPIIYINIVFSRTLWR